MRRRDKRAGYIMSHIDTTFTQCPHGSPKCEACNNKRVVEWINVKNRLPEFFKKVLVSYYGGIQVVELSPKGWCFPENKINDHMYIGYNFTHPVEIVDYWSLIDHLHPQNIIAKFCDV